VPIPDGSSSDAPVMRPGPRLLKKLSLVFFLRVWRTAAAAPADRGAAALLAKSLANKSFAKTCFARESFRSQTFAVFVECLLRGLMFPHRLLGLGAAFGVPGLACFRGKKPGRLSCKLIAHAGTTHKFPKSCPTAAQDGCQDTVRQVSAFDGASLKTDCQIHFSQIHFSEVLIAVNLVLSFEPNPFTAADAFGLMHHVQEP
jgi:hypothetical protein